MYSRDAHPSYVSIANMRSLYFRLSLGGSGAPTIDYGSNWIASVTHTGGSNTITVTAKDSIYDVVDADVAWRDPSSNGQYASIGQYANERSNTALTFVLSFFSAGGSASNDPTGKVGGFIEINNGNVSTPGGN